MWAAAWPAAEAAAREALQEIRHRLEAHLAACGSVRWEACTPEILHVDPIRESPTGVASGQDMHGEAEHAPLASAGNYANWSSPEEDSTVYQMVEASLACANLGAMGMASVHVAGVTRVYNDGLAAMCAHITLFITAPCVVCPVMRITGDDTS
jgi:hypothetical protein